MRCYYFTTDDYVKFVKISVEIKNRWPLSIDRDAPVFVMAGKLFRCPYFVIIVFHWANLISSRSQLFSSRLAVNFDFIYILQFFPALVRPRFLKTAFTAPYFIQADDLEANHRIFKLTFLYFLSCSPARAKTPRFEHICALKRKLIYFTVPCHCCLFFFFQSFNYSTILRCGNFLQHLFLPLT